jgi:rubrerythrin
MNHKPRGGVVRTRGTHDLEDLRRRSRLERRRETGAGDGLVRATDHRCAVCGYQISTGRPFPLCPMCGGRDWRLIALSRQARSL